MRVSAKRFGMDQNENQTDNQLELERLLQRQDEGEDVDLELAILMSTMDMNANVGNTDEKKQNEEKDQNENQKNEQHESTDHQQSKDKINEVEVKGGENDAKGNGKTNTIKEKPSVLTEEQRLMQQEDIRHVMNTQLEPKKGSHEESKTGNDAKIQKETRNTTPTEQIDSCQIDTTPRERIRMDFGLDSGINNSSQCGLYDAFSPNCDIPLGTASPPPALVTLLVRTQLVINMVVQLAQTVAQFGQSETGQSACQTMIAELLEHLNELMSTYYSDSSVSPLLANESNTGFALANCHSNGRTDNTPNGRTFITALSEQQIEFLTKSSEALWDINESALVLQTKRMGLDKFRENVRLVPKWALRNTDRIG